MTNSKKRYGMLMVFGLGAGLLSGLFGLGGGIIIIPGLMVALKMDQRRAHGTSLGGVLVLSIASSITYLVHNNIDWTLTAWLTVGSVLGALLGAKLLIVVSKRTLTIAFIGVLVIAGVRMFFPVNGTIEHPQVSIVMGLCLVLIGFAIGALAGMLGIGGGLMSVPILVVLYGISPVVAKGTSLAVVIPTALTGTIQNLRNKNSDLVAAGVVSASGVFTAILGAWLADHMNDALSNVLFAILLLVIALRMLLQLKKASVTTSAQ